MCFGNCERSNIECQNCKVIRSCYNKTFNKNSKEILFYNRNISIIREVKHGIVQTVSETD